MAATRQVVVHNLADRTGTAYAYQKPYVVKWRVGGKQRSRAFPNRHTADRYRARLVYALDHHEEFDLQTGEPVSWCLGSTTRRLVSRGASHRACPVQPGAHGQERPLDLTGLDLMDREAVQMQPVPGPLRRPGELAFVVARRVESHVEQTVPHRRHQLLGDLGVGERACSDD